MCYCWLPADPRQLTPCFAANTHTQSSEASSLLQRLRNGHNQSSGITTQDNHGTEQQQVLPQCHPPPHRAPTSTDQHHARHHSEQVVPSPPPATAATATSDNKAPPVQPLPPVHASANWHAVALAVVFTLWRQLPLWWPPSWQLRWWCMRVL